jgi:hypothetical protein
MSSIFVTGRTYLGLVRPHWKLSASAGLCWRQSSAMSIAGGLTPDSAGNLYEACVSRGTTSRSVH